MNDRLQTFVRYMFEGELNQNQIAEKLGVTPKTLSEWKKKDEYQDEMIRLERRYLKGLSKKAIRTMEKLLDARSEKVRYDAAADILDRTGHKSIEHIDLTQHVVFTEDVPLDD